MRDLAVRSSGFVLCAIGLSFSLGAASAAKPSAAKSKLSQADAHRQMLRSLLSAGPSRIDQVLNAPVSSVPGLRALATYRTELDPGKAAIVDKGGATLALRGNHLEFTPARGKARKASTADLVSLGIKTPGDLQKLVEDQVFALAGGKKTGPRAMTIKEASRILTERVHEARTLASELQYGSGMRLGEDVDLLAAHHAWSPAKNAEALPLASSPEVGTLTLSDTLLMQRPAKYKLSPEMDPDDAVLVTSRDLLHVGLTHQEDFQALAATLLRKMAGTSNLKVARERLRAEMEGEPTPAQPLIDGFHLHEDVKLLKQAARVMGQRTGQKTGAVLIAKGEGEDLRFGKGSQLGKERLIVVSHATGDRREATVADLRRFGLASKAALDKHLEKALLEIAPEDLR